MVGQWEALCYDLRGELLLSGLSRLNICSYWVQDWLSKMKDGKREIWPHLEDTYGNKSAAMWFYRWQVFFIACAELFAYEGGDTWGVSHYLFRKP